MVALDVVLVAEDHGYGLVDHVVTKDQHVLGLVALGAAGSVDKVDGGAQGLLGGVVQDAVLAHVGDGVLAALAHHVVHVQAILAVREVAQPNVGAGTVAGERDRRAKGHGAAAQRVLANLNAGVVVRVHAHALEVLLRGTNAHDLGDCDMCALLGNHAQERGRGGGSGACAARGNHDGDRGTRTYHDAGVCDLALVGVDGHHDGLLAHGVRGDLHVAGVGGLRGHPTGDLLAHAALDVREELGERKVHIALARDFGHRERDVIGAQAVPGLRGGLVHAVEHDGGVLVCH